ncbi:Glucose--fructose oxidoreductase [Thalassocella blandensis]|nr:Glucose--fructose oxidoreductase [Thalassocella blandensis]
MNKVRFGMIGGGPGAFIGHIHRIAAALDGELTLVCGAFSQNLEKSITTGQQLGIHPERIYANYSEMFERENALPEEERMECVAIVTPNHLHAEIALAALQHGFHVFCEKPATRTVEECEQLQNAVTTSGKLFGLAHTYLGYPMVVEASTRVKQNAIGTVQKVVVEYSQGWLADINFDQDNKQANWRLDPARAGLSCCMGDIGSHAANLSEFICGEKITQVLADLGSVVPGRQLDDDASVFLRYENGARGVLIASQISIGEENNLRIKVYGDKGSLSWQQQEPNTLTIYEGQHAAQVLRAGQGYLSTSALDLCRTPPGHPEGYIEAFANLYRQFALAIKTQREADKASLGSVCGIEDAVHGMKILQAVIDSNAAGNTWQRI